jgi:uncharacterized protein YdaU (DUF1376 family)
MATNYPWFPFYAADWTLSVVGMNATQRGIYISLLAYQWANGYAPAMREQCARIAGAHPMQDEDWDAVRVKFAVDGDRMRNLRLEECRGVCKSRSDNAKRAAAASWEKRAHSDRNATAMQSQSDGNASQSHSHSHISQSPPTPPSRKVGRRRGNDSLPF